MERRGERETGREEERVRRAGGNEETERIDEQDGRFEFDKQVNGDDGDGSGSQPGKD